MGLVHFEDGKVLYYPYTPSTTAGYAFMSIFLLITALHIWQVVRLRTRFFVPMIIGGVCETFGHYGRAWAGKSPDSPKPFMLQLMLILVSPVFIAATIYMTLGKFKQSILGRPKRKCTVTSLFVVSDIIAFCTQIGGGLVQVTGSLKIMKIGDRVVLGGLLFQLGVLAVYLCLVFRFYKEAGEQTARDTPVWKPLVWVLAVCVVVIWVRNLVRAVEFAQGFHGFISEHEAMLYIFDSFLVLSIMVLFVPFHQCQAIRRLRDMNWEPVELKRRTAQV